MSEIVTFEQKQRLKKIGYDTTKLTITTVNGLFTHVERPIPVFEALDFIREKGIYCGVYPFMWGYKGMAIVQDKHNPCTIEVEPLDTHPLAESALLDAVLTYLESSKEKSFSKS